MDKEGVGAKCNLSYSNLNGFLNFRCLATKIEVFFELYFFELKLLGD